MNKSVYLALMDESFVKGDVQEAAQTLFIPTSENKHSPNVEQMLLF